MSNQRRLAWSSALSDLRADRAPRESIREIRSRSPLASSIGAIAPLSGWRGKSGCRYVVGVHDLDADIVVDAGPAVVLAVRRDATGEAHIISATSAFGETVFLARAWLSEMEAAEATELHIHRLASTAAERAAIIADLTASELEGAL